MVSASWTLESEDVETLLKVGVDVIRLKSQYLDTVLNDLRFVNDLTVSIYMNHIIWTWT